MHNRAKKLKIALPVPITMASLPMRTSPDDPTLVWEDWPFLLPHEMAPWLLSSSHMFVVSPTLVCAYGTFELP